ncbi:MAG: hypothetical protein ACFNM7_00645 [Prevotella conceptionensis]
MALSPYRPLEPVRISFGCRHIARLVLEGVVGPRGENKTGKMKANQRWMNWKQWKRLELFDKRYKGRFRLNLLRKVVVTFPM